jgi:hypothetical protein
MYALHNDYMYIVRFVRFPVPGLKMRRLGRAANIWETQVLHGCVWVEVNWLLSLVTRRPGQLLHMRATYITPVRALFPALLCAYRHLRFTR